VGPCARWCATATARTDAEEDNVFGGGGTEDCSPDAAAGFKVEKRLAAAEFKVGEEETRFCVLLLVFFFFFFFFFLNLERGIG